MTFRNRRITVYRFICVLMISPFFLITTIKWKCGDGVKEQDKKTRLRGIEAQKANIAAATCVARVMRSSLGPKGLDKMLQSHDGDVCISKPLLSAASQRIPPALLHQPMSCHTKVY